MKSMRVQRLRRHTTTVPHCNAEEDKQRETGDESKKLFRERLEVVLVDTMRVNKAAVTTLAVLYFQARTLPAGSKDVREQ